jgi:polysaccharide chain length determinant protein (PEP-CTERM system associated)
LEDQEQSLNIANYVKIAIRRKWCIITPLVIGIVISIFVYEYLPKVYKATTMILVQPQKVPENYVRSTITGSVTYQLSTISQEILSRTKLEKVIHEYNLFADLRKKYSLEEIIEKMRKAIEVSVQSKHQSDQAQNTFSISFEGEDPRTVMMVANRLASLFMEENLKVREIQAEGTTDFLRKELQTMEEQLQKKEQDIRKYKERNMGQLPQQLDANLKILERLQQQLQTTSENIRISEDRGILYQNQIEQFKRTETAPVQKRQSNAPISIDGDSLEEIPGEVIPEDPLIAQWNLLKKDLQDARSRYTENHPEVIALKRKIANMEPQVAELRKKQEALKEARLAERKAREAKIAQRNAREEKQGAENSPLPGADTNTERLLSQYRDQYNEAQLEGKRLKVEKKNLEEQILLYQKRIEDTPKQEQELTLLTRDYDLLKTNYQSLLDKKIQAEMSQNLERKQQGEQFKILDPAPLPEKPVRPDRNKILLLGTFFGLVTGLGLTWLRESMDQSFHSEEELEAQLGIPILAFLPNLKREERDSRKDRISHV